MSWTKEDADNIAQALKTFESGELGKMFAVIANATLSYTEQVKEAFHDIVLSLQEAGEAIGDLAEIAKEPEIPDDIPALKKQIKHCKNPMELKRLNRRLNAALKQKRK